MKFPSLPFIVLDTETTGFVPRVNRIIEFASVRYENGKEASRFSQLFDIPEEIPMTVQVLTRITQEAIKGQPLFGQMREKILEEIGSDTLIIGQNVSFDLKMLRGEGIDLFDHPWIDTSMLASLVYPELKSYSLGYVSSVLGLNHEPVHRALGDVRATLELLGRCLERIGEMPGDLFKEALSVMERGPEGYRCLFASLPAPKKKTRPQWLKKPVPQPVAAKDSSSFAEAVFAPPPVGTVSVVEEILDPSSLANLLTWASTDTKSVQWVAVKNLPACLRRTFVPAGVRVLHPPSHLPDPSAVASLLKQDHFTADEATLAVKMLWYAPQHINALPLHGDERAVWHGKLACSSASRAYRSQFEHLPGVLLLDQRQLLSFLQDPDHSAHGALTERAHIILDDASMLEDTATQAFGWACPIDELRAAAERDETLTRFLDLLQIWAERTRVTQDYYKIKQDDLSSPEAGALRERLESILQTAHGDTVTSHLKDLAHMLSPKEFHGRIAWIEQRQNGSQFLKSVPEFVSNILRDALYRRFPTTLIAPPGSAPALIEILPAAFPVREHGAQQQARIPFRFEREMQLKDFFSHPPEGRTVLLIPSRRVIEECFVMHTIPLEARGVRLICQNLSGGQERMQAEFLAAGSPCLWLVTPWTYEQVELPGGSIDHLFLMSLPFDQPSHPIVSKRCEHYQNAFSAYTLPRMEHRLFRLFRTFARHRTHDGDIVLFDQRLATKGYGKDVLSYLNHFCETPDSRDSAKEKKGEKGQMALFA
ncbi:MAG: exonuclease domain-containing protein [Candidatus Peregrinibacteria bacterium]